MHRTLPDRTKEDPLIKGLLDQVVTGLQKEGLTFTIDTDIHGKQEYKYTDSILGLQIVITGFFSRHQSVEPTFHLRLELSQGASITIGSVANAVLHEICRTADLEQIVPRNAECLTTDSAEAVIQCVLRILSRWAALLPRVAAMAAWHRADINALAKEASFPESSQST